MPTEDVQEVWPPAPSAGDGPPASPGSEPQAKGPRYSRLLGWVGPVLLGGAGAAEGSIQFPILLLRLIGASKQTGGLVWVLAAGLAASFIGVFVGFAFGVGVWFGGKALVGWWKRARSRPPSQ